MAVGEIRVAFCLGKLVAEEINHLPQQAGVRLEELVHLGHIQSGQRRLHHFGRAIVAETTSGALGVVQISSGLLQICHEPAPLYDFRQQVGDLLAGQMHPAQLGDRVVAVFHEHFFIELLGSLQADCGINGDVARDVQIAHELVQKQPAKAFVRARIAGEERALHHLGQVHQGEHRP